MTDVGHRDGAFNGGLWIISPKGAVERLLEPGAYPLAVGGLRRIAVTHPPSRTPFAGVAGPINLVDHARRVAVPHSSGPLWCASWSADGRELAYLAGAYTVYRRLSSGESAEGIRGSLWVVHASAPKRPERVESGVFSGCPVWAPRRNRLAYLAGRGAHPDAWRIRAWAAGTSGTMATIRSPAPTLQSTIAQTFAWEPSGNGLVYLDDKGLFRVRRGDPRASRKLSPRGALAPLIRTGVRMAANRPDAQYDRLLRLSPDGRTAALQIGRAVGIVRLDSGRLIRLIATGFRSWVGSRMMLGVAEDHGLSLFLYRTSSPERRLIYRGRFKAPLVVDPASRWFGYGTSHGRRVTVRRVDGSLLKTVRLGFDPSAVAAIDKSGRSSAPPLP